MAPASAAAASAPQQQPPAMAPASAAAASAPQLQPPAVAVAAAAARQLQSPVVAVAPASAAADDESDLYLAGCFEDEPPAEEEVVAAAAAAEDVPPAEPGPSVGVTRTGKGKAKAKAKNGKVNSRGRLLAKLQRKLAARRAVAADAAEQAANIAGSDDLKFDAEQVEPDLVEADADADADANERVGLDRRALPAPFVAGSRHATVTTCLLHPIGVSGTGPIKAEGDGAVSVEEYRALQIKLKTALQLLFGNMNLPMLCFQTVKVLILLL